jgi:hypothetical protein
MSFGWDVSSYYAIEKKRYKGNYEPVETGDYIDGIGKRTPWVLVLKKCVFFDDLEDARDGIQVAMEDLDFEHLCTDEERRLDWEVYTWKGSPWNFDLNMAQGMPFPDVRVSVRPVVLRE